MSRQCPHCKQALPPAPRTTTRNSRPGGRQVPLGPAIRALAAFLEDKQGMSEAQAQRTAKRVMFKALPARQRRPRQHSQIGEAA